MIEAAHERSRGTYGSSGVHAELQPKGHRVGRKRIARRMRVRGIQAHRRCRVKVTTTSQRAHPLAPNLRHQHFEAQRPREKGLADITYRATDEG